jgi:hypothetical protein
MLLVTYARRLTSAFTAFDALAADRRGASLPPSAAASLSVVAEYVATVLGDAAAMARGGPAAPEAEPPVIDGDAPEAPWGQALERIVRWTALLAAGLRERAR